MNLSYINLQKLSKKINIEPNELNKNINETIYLKLIELNEGFCIDEGYIIKNSIKIINKSMGHIINLNNPMLINDEGEFIWNGQNQFNQEVANGVYFCRLNLDGKIYWTKLMVINS